MGLRDEIEASYIDENGLVSAFPVMGRGRDSGGNQLGITALYFLQLFRRGEARDPKLSDQFRAIVKACNAGSAGLLNRSPTKLGDQEGWDDYILVAAASGINALNLPAAPQIFMQGRNNLYCYDNVDPDKPLIKQLFSSAFFGRFPPFMAHVGFCAGSPPSFFQCLLWSFGVVSAAFSRDATARVLAYAMVESMMGMSFVCTLATAVWSYSTRSRTIKDAVSLWLSVAKDGLGAPLPNVDHPIVKYWRD